MKRRPRAGAAGTRVLIERPDLHKVGLAQRVLQNLFGIVRVAKDVAGPAEIARIVEAEDTMPAITHDA